MIIQKKYRDKSVICCFCPRSKCLPWDTDTPCFHIANIPAVQKQVFSSSGQRLGFWVVSRILRSFSLYPTFSLKFFSRPESYSFPFIFDLMIQFLSYSSHWSLLSLHLYLASSVYFCSSLQRSKCNDSLHLLLFHAMTFSRYSFFFFKIDSLFFLQSKPCYWPPFLPNKSQFSWKQTISFLLMSNNFTKNSRKTVCKNPSDLKIYVQTLSSFPKAILIF